jgi:hypothetical protein
MSYTKQQFKQGDVLRAAQLNAMDEQIKTLSENQGGVTREEMETAIEEAINEAILNTMNTPV